MFDGPVISIDIPEEDGWQDNLAARILLVITALLLMRMGFRIWGALMPEFYAGAAASLLVFGCAVQLLVFAASDLDLEVWGPRIAIGVTFVVGVAVLLALYRFWLDKIQTDALLFSRAGLSTLMQGTDPYIVDMAPWIDSWRGPQYSTPQIDGTPVTQLSYPSGSILWFVPQFVTVGETQWGIRLTLVFAALASLVVTAVSLPRQLAVAAPAIILAPRNLVVTAAGGVFWPLWVLPLLLAIRDWGGGRWRRVGIWLGIAAATKQLVWAVGPFLLIWGVRGERVPLATIAAWTSGVFLALNLPFILWHPQAWLTSVLTPVGSGASLVFQGVGLATFPTVGYQLARWWFKLAILAAVWASLAAYWLYFDELKWAVWVVPAFIFLFHSRSLTSYFVSFAPIAAVAAAGAKGRLRSGGLLASLRDRAANRGARAWV